MKLTICKRCDAKNVYWTQSHFGKWVMKDEQGNDHTCDDGKIKTVKCKYCNANDLHWAEEINQQTKSKKMVLTESYGLQHACDARIAFIAKEKQEKQDKYEAEKKRVKLHADGPCPECKGGGYGQFVFGRQVLCTNCHGHCVFTELTRKHMLAEMRRVIWPQMKEKYSRPYGSRRW